MGEDAVEFRHQTRLQRLAQRLGKAVGDFFVVAGSQQGPGLYDAAGRIEAGGDQEAFGRGRIVSGKEPRHGPIDRHPGLVEIQQRAVFVKKNRRYGHGVVPYPQWLP